MIYFVTCRVYSLLWSLLVGLRTTAGDAWPGMKVEYFFGKNIIIVSFTLRPLSKSLLTSFQLLVDWKLNQVSPCWNFMGKEETNKTHVWTFMSVPKGKQILYLVNDCWITVDLLRIIFSCILRTTLVRSQLQLLYFCQMETVHHCLVWRINFSHICHKKASLLIFKTEYRYLLLQQELTWNALRMVDRPVSIIQSFVSDSQAPLHLFGHWAKY